MRHRHALLVLGLIVCSVAPAWAQKVEISPFIGYRYGGSLTEYSTGIKFDLEDEQSYGAMLDFTLDLDNQLELLWSHQSTGLRVGGTYPDGLFPVEVDYIQIGGVQLFDDDATRPFLVGAIGASRFKPEQPDLSSYTRFSLSAGGGIKLMPNDHIGLRLEGRLYATWASGAGAIFCGGGGCSFGIAGSVLWQVEATAGIVFGMGK